MENLALRQQLTAATRITRAPTFQTRDRLFRMPWPESGGTGARRWCSSSQTPSCGGTATGSAGDGADIRDMVRIGVHPSIGRSALSSERWRRPTRCGGHRAFMASCVCSVSTSQSAPCTSAVADVEDFPHELPRFVGVDRFLRRPHVDGSRTVCSGLAVARRRRLVHVNITGHPTATWSAQRLSGRHDAPLVGPRPRPQLRDVIKRRRAGMGIAEMVSAPMSPWQDWFRVRSGFLVPGATTTRCRGGFRPPEEAHCRIRLLE